MTGVVIQLFGRDKPELVELPPLVTAPAPTATGPVLNLCDQPVVSARCASLVKWGDREHLYPCGGLLAYQGGTWQHANVCEDCYDSDEPCPASIGHRSCDDPQPAECVHGKCTEPADIEVQCVNGGNGQCCSCCWVTDGHADIDDGSGWTPTQRRWAR